jgi:hypothetical protein
MAADVWVPCSALVNGVCTNGFIAPPACANTAGIGVWNMTPCMSEKWAARLFPETGAPSADDVMRARERAADS